jgi:hypothetical protein
MPSLPDLLHDAVGNTWRQTPFDELRERAAARRAVRHRRRAITGSAVLVLALVAAATAVAVGRRDDGSGRVDTAPPDGVFPSPTDAVFIFDDGSQGVVMVDVDQRLSVHRPDIGNQPGDQPYRLIRAGDRLIVGRDEIYSAPLGVGPSELLGEASFFVPGSLEDDVWLVDYSGRPADSGRAHLRHVDAGGEVRADYDYTGPEGSLTANGRPIGLDQWLVVPTPSGLDLTSPYQPNLGDGQARVLDVWGAFLAWCDGDCRRVNVDLFEGAGGHFETPDLDSSIATVSLSPYLNHMAVATADRSVFIAERVSFSEFRITELSGVPPGDTPLSLTWSPDGDTLFMAERSHGQETTGVGRYTPATAPPEGSPAAETVEWATLPFGGLGDLVVATQDEVGELPETQEPHPDCPPSPEACTVPFN